MINLLNEPLLTREATRGSFLPEVGSSYIHGPHDEDRAALGADWYQRASSSGIQFVEIAERSRTSVEVNFPGQPDHGRELSLLNLQELVSFVTSLPPPIYLDVTGLQHNIWAPLLRSLMVSEISFFLVYVEPADYKRSPAPSAGMRFDLSVKLGGIAPLPGFARITRPRNRDTLFVPMLGFEGDRLGYVSLNVQPAADSTIPIVGVPGFRPEFPFYSFVGNRTVLEEGFTFRKIKFAKANCPFDAFHALRCIFDDHGRPYLRVAPIGTKPHGIAAVLFNLSLPSSTEIVYDNPVRKLKRTSGEARVCIYNVSTFVESELFKNEGSYA